MGTRGAGMGTDHVKRIIPARLGAANKGKWDAVGLSGATVLLTGGSSGIGAATARTLAAAGARILVAGRNAARLRAIAAETGGIALAADLAVPDGAAALAEAAMRAATVWDSDGYEAAANAVPLQARIPVPRKPMNWPAPLPGPPGPGSTTDGIAIATVPRPRLGLQGGRRREPCLRRTASIS